MLKIKDDYKASKIVIGPEKKFKRKIM